MPKFIWREHDHGDYAKFKETIKGIQVEAYVQDMDGDGASWQVKENGVIIAQGTCYDNDYLETATKLAITFISMDISMRMFMWAHGSSLNKYMSEPVMPENYEPAF